MNDLEDFLYARIDEDEDQARYATSRPWANVRVNEGIDGWDVEARAADGTHLDVAVDHARPPQGACSTSDAAHIARWDPTRALAECDAKRRILDLATCTACDVQDQPCKHREQTLRILALPYASHRDYRKQWRP